MGLALRGLNHKSYVWAANAKWKYWKCWNHDSKQSCIINKIKESCVNCTRIRVLSDLYFPVKELNIVSLCRKLSVRDSPFDGIFYTLYTNSHIIVETHRTVCQFTSLKHGQMEKCYSLFKMIDFTSLNQFCLISPIQLKSCRIPKSQNNQWIKESLNCNLYLY